jgi:ribosomal protein S18 acetylase RimI-like enzyme
MDDIKDVVTIRPYVETDNAFVFNSWLHGFRQGCEYFRLIDGDAYFDNYGKVINTILDRDNVDIKIICLKEDQELIVGYSITEILPQLLILHWVYVKPDWRDNGLANMLTPEGVTTCTHLTKTGRAILKKHQEVKFNPFIIGA